MSCERVSELLPDYFEGELDAAERSAVEAHAKDCAQCAAVVHDVEAIRREAGSLPLMTPSRDLWSGIEQRISAEVIPLESAQSRVMKRFSARTWMSAAAAALVVTTAGITYLVTARGSAPAASPSRVAAASPAPQSVASIAPESAATEPAATPNSSVPQVTEASSRRLASSTGDRERAPVGVTGYPGSPQAEAAYAHEIRVLESMVTDRSSQLDTGTVRIIRRNLEIIDAAIAQSKAALARDPASRLLYDQLNHVLDKKVELLRTAVMLPSST